MMHQSRLWAVRIGSRWFEVVAVRRRIQGAHGVALDALSAELGDIPRCRGELDPSVRDRALMLVAAALAGEQDEPRAKGSVRGRKAVLGQRERRAA